MSVINYVKDVLREGLRDLVRDVGDDVNAVISRRLNQIKREIIKDIFGLLIIIIGIGLLSIGSIFFLIESMGLSRTLSFLIIGIIVLFIGIIIKLIR
jgi:hypothetical protein